MKIKEIEFKLMFKTIIVIIMLFAFLLFSSAGCDILKEKFKEPWADFVDVNNYTKFKKVFINEMTKYEFSDELLDYSFCSIILRGVVKDFGTKEGDIKLDVIADFYSEKADKLFKKIVSNKKLNEDEAYNYLVEIGSFTTLASRAYNKIEDPNHIQGILQYCNKLL